MEEEWVISGSPLTSMLQRTGWFPYAREIADDAVRVEEEIGKTHYLRNFTSKHSESSTTRDDDRERHPLFFLSFGTDY